MPVAVLRRKGGAQGVPQAAFPCRGSAAMRDNCTMDKSEIDPEQQALREPRLWRDNGWTAQVIKNEDDDGWAVAMTPDGQAEPALVGPWTMGRDKKNPKPLDTTAFNTLVKTADEFVRRQEQQLHAALHRQIDISHDGGRVSARSTSSRTKKIPRRCCAPQIRPARCWVKPGSRLVSG